MNDQTTTSVIGPIDRATWYCMRQSRTWAKDHEGIPEYALEVKAEKDLYRYFMDSVFKRAA